MIGQRNGQLGVFFILASMALGSLATATDPVPPKIVPFKPSETVNVRQVGAEGDGRADDTASFQQALRGGDRLVIIPQGVYRIGQTLKVDSRTWIQADKEAVIRLADGAGKDADTFLLTNADPVGGNRDIVVEGGVWDGNNAQNPRGPRHGPRPAYGGVVLSFAKVRNLVIRDLTVRNPESFSIRLGEVEDFLVENIVFDQSLPRPNQDGVHVNGFSRRGVIRHLRVSSPTGTNDDMVALNADDDITAMFCAGMKAGPIHDIRVEDIAAENAYTFVRLLSTGNSIENVVIDGIVGGFRMNAINIDHWRFPLGSGKLRNITIRNCRVHGKGPRSHPFVVLNSSVDGLRIENFLRQAGGNSTAPTLLVDNKKVNNLRMRGLDPRQLRQLRKSLSEAGANLPATDPAASGPSKGNFQINKGSRVVLCQGNIVELNLKTVEGRD